VLAHLPAAKPHERTLTEVTAAFYKLRPSPSA
jgi:hypothetical protein